MGQGGEPDQLAHAAAHADLVHETQGVPYNQARVGIIAGSTAMKMESQSLRCKAEFARWARGWQV